MTLKEQHHFLIEQARKCACEDEKRRLLACAATMWDFWQDAHQEVIEEYDSADHTVVGPAKKKVAFRLNEATTVMVDEEFKIKDIIKQYPNEARRKPVHA